MKLSVRAAVVIAAVTTASVAGYAVAAASAPTHSAPSHSGKGTPSAAGQPRLASSPAKADLVYVPLAAACRAVDTRRNGGVIAAGKTRSFFVAGATGFAAQGGTSGGCNVPTTAMAIAAQLTALDATAAGSFATAPSPGAPTGTAVSFGTAQASTSGATLTVTPGTAKGMTVKAVGGGANLQLDITGYYEQQIEAYIIDTGQIFSQTNRVLSATNPSAGHYQVMVDVDVLSCSVTATTGVALDVTMVAIGNPGHVVDVYAYDAAGNFVNISFNLTVTC